MSISIAAMSACISLLQAVIGIKQISFAAPKARKEALQTGMASEPACQSPNPIECRVVKVC